MDRPKCLLWVLISHVSRITIHILRGLVPSWYCDTWIGCFDARWAPLEIVYSRHFAILPCCCIVFIFRSEWCGSTVTPAHFPSGISRSHWLDWKATLLLFLFLTLIDDCHRLRRRKLLPFLYRTHCLVTIWWGLHRQFGRLLHYNVFKS